MGIFLIVLILIFALAPLLMPLIRRWLMRRAENYLRAQMGMPPRNSQGRKRQQSGPRGTRFRESHHSPRRGPSYPGPVIPHEYAEDVEYTEIRTFSQTDIAGSESKAGSPFAGFHEEQVEDVEFEEISFKKRRS